MEPKIDRPYLDGVILSEDADRGLERLNQIGVLEQVFPEVQAIVGFGGRGSGHKALWPHTKQVVVQAEARPEIRWAALFHDVGKVQSFSTDTGKVAFHGHEFLSARLWNQAAKRTGLFDDIRKKVYFLVRNLGTAESYHPQWTDSAIRRFGRDMGEHLNDIITLSRADITTAQAALRRKNLGRLDELLARVRALQEVDARPALLPKGLGDALSEAFGIPPSKALGDLMKRLKAAVEAGELPSGAEADVYIQWLRGQVTTS